MLSIDIVNTQRRLQQVLVCIIENNLIDFEMENVKIVSDGKQCLCPGNDLL